MTTYGSAAGANSLVQSWDGATNPTAAQVAVWLADGNAKINRAIAGAGYSVPITSDAALYPELTSLENLYAAAYILRSQAIDTASGETEARSEVWLKDFYAQLKDLALSNLTPLGASLLSSSTANRRRRVGTLQMRKVDGYASQARPPGTNDAWEQWAIDPSEYTEPAVPSE